MVTQQLRQSWDLGPDSCDSTVLTPTNPFPPGFHAQTEVPSALLETSSEAGLIVDGGSEDGEQPRLLCPPSKVSDHQEPRAVPVCSGSGTRASPVP